MGRRCARNIDKEKIVYSACQCRIYTVYLCIPRSHKILRDLSPFLEGRKREKYLKYNEEKYKVQCNAIRIRNVFIAI